MKISAAERIAIIITVILLAFVAGFFAGRTTVSGSVVIEAAAPENSAYVYSAAEVSQKAAVSESEAPEVMASSAAAEAAVVSEASSSCEENTLWTPDCGELLDLNTAVEEELENLPEIGPVLAGKIIDYRSSNGYFQSVDELKNVDGIGDKIYSTISGYLKVDDNNENTGS